MSSKLKANIILQQSIAMIYERKIVALQNKASSYLKQEIPDNRFEKITVRNTRKKTLVKVQQQNTV